MLRKWNGVKVDNKKSKLIIFLLFICIITACGSKKYNDFIVVEEIFIGGKMYQIGVDYDRLYVNKDGEMKNIGLCTNEFEEVIKLPEGKIHTSYGLVYDNNIPDPKSFNMIEKSNLVNTYKSDLINSSNYLVTMQSLGWGIVESYKNDLYYDCFMKKNNILMRCIVFKDSIKIFYDINETTNSKTYIEKIYQKYNFKL